MERKGEAALAPTPTVEAVVRGEEPAAGREREAKGDAIAAGMGGSGGSCDGVVRRRGVTVIRWSVSKIR